MKEIQLAAMREARETLLIAAANFGGLAPSARDRCIRSANALHEAYTPATAPLLTHKAEDAPSDAELADTPTPKPQGGMWTLTAPDGRTYQADSPLRCCGLEQRERVPADVAMARIFRSASEPDDSELLDWLDATNKRFKMGWKVGVAPAGNCSVQSVICLGNSEPVTIRAAIRAARAKE